MASDQEYVDYVCEQLSTAGIITYRKMFGEYAVYCDGKVIGLVCDNQFYLKITEAGRSMLPGMAEGFPYPGARPYFVIDALDDSAALGNVVRATYDELPEPKPKKKKDPGKKKR